MANYLVFGYLTVTVSARVEAGSEAEARRKALELSSPSLCHQCSCAGSNDPHSWTMEGFDDTPEDAVQEVEKE